MSMLQPICFSSSRYHNVLAAEPLGLPCWGEEGGHCWHWRTWADGGEFGDGGDDHDGGNGPIHFLPHFFLLLLNLTYVRSGFHTSSQSKISL